MLYIREEKIVFGSDCCLACQKCRELSLYGICGYVSKEESWAPSPRFCHYLCLAVRLLLLRSPRMGFSNIRELGIDDSLVPVYPCT